jgi:hypothetical protein
MSFPQKILAVVVMFGGGALIGTYALKLEYAYLVALIGIPIIWILWAKEIRQI